MTLELSPIGMYTVRIRVTAKRLDEVVERNKSYNVAIDLTEKWGEHGFTITPQQSKDVPTMSMHGVPSLQFRRYMNAYV